MNRYKHISIYCVLYFLQNSFCIAQNLVLNPGFELVSDCGVLTFYDGMENSILDWNTYDYNDNSPDVFNECFSTVGMTPQSSPFGITDTHSGSGIVGIGIIPSTDHREAISSSLINPMTKDSAYCVSIWVKNARTENYNYECQNIGVYFSDTQISHSTIRTFSAQIHSNVDLSQNTWVNISGYYIANGGESFVNLGYFGSDLDYFHQNSSSNVLYYYLDDISVTLCNKDSLLSVVLELPNIFTPDGNSVNDSYKIKNNNIKNMKVFILNRWGNLIVEYDGLIHSWDGMDANGNRMEEGVYFVKVVAETSFGELLSKQEFVHLYYKQ